MKVTSKTIDDGETSVSIDLFEGAPLPRKIKARIQDEVGQYLVEQTLVAMNEKKSPVSGGAWKQTLSKEYAKKKKEEVGSTEANLEYDGVLKDSLDFEKIEDGIAIGVFGERAGAADGHNNLSGKSSLPKRQFLPDVGQSYKGPIKREIERIIADVIAEEISFRASDFEGVATKKALYEVLGEKFPGMSRAEINLTVYRNETLLDLLADLGLDGLL